MLALAYAIEVIETLTALINAGMEIADFSSNAIAALEAMKKERRNPTAEEKAALDKVIADMEAQAPDVG